MSPPSLGAYSTTLAAASRSNARRTPASLAALSSPPRHLATRSSSFHPPSIDTALSRVSGPTEACDESQRSSPPPNLEVILFSASSPASAPWPMASPESAATSTRSSAATSSEAATACTCGSGCADANKIAVAARGPTAAASKSTSSVGLLAASATVTAAVDKRHVHSVAFTEPSIALSAARRLCTTALRSTVGETCVTCLRIARRAAASTSLCPHPDASATARKLVSSAA